MARNLTDKGVAGLKPKKSIYTFRDPNMPGHFIRVRPTGSKQFVAMARDMNGTQVWETVGTFPLIGIDEAREKAKGILKRVKTGQDRSGPKSFEKVASDWLHHYVEAQRLITEPAIRRTLRNHVLPVWAARDFKSITRSDVAELLDSIADKAGPVAADKTLAYLSKLFRWYVTRDGEYVSPIVPGMRRTQPGDRVRERVLSDDEIRTVWSKAEGVFGDLVKLLLFTGQRREKVAAMKWADVSVDGVWSVKNGDKREKGSGGDLVLPPMALDILRARPRLGDNPHVFASRGNTHLSGYSKAKAALDKKTGITGWTLHDLRRTARSLMSRARVADEHGERVLGHAIGGVQGVYNRHDHFEQKREALKMLAGLIESILRNDDADKKVRRLRG